MTIRRALLALALLAGLSRDAAGADGAQQDHDMRGFKLYGLPLVPDRATGAVALSFVTPGTGYLKSTGLNGSISAVATIPYADITGGPTSLPPSGAAGGGLGGTYPNPTVTLTATQIGFGSGSNTLTGSSALTWDGSRVVISRAAVGAIATELLIDNTDTTGAAGSAVRFTLNGGSTTVGSLSMNQNGSIALSAGAAGTGPTQLVVGKTSGASSLVINLDNGDTFLANPGSQRLTTTTAGFAWLPTVLGPPTGVPSAVATLLRPLIYDASDTRLYSYNSGAWHYAAFDDGVAAAVTLAATQVGFGSGANTLTGSASMVYDSTAERLTLNRTNVAASGVPLILNNTDATTGAGSGMGFNLGGTRIATLSVAKLATGNSLANLYVGTASTPPFQVYVEDGDVVLARKASQPATSTTTGFVWYPQVQGVPSGVPATGGPLNRATIVDDINRRLYVYLGSAWHYTAFDDGAAAAALASAHFVTNQSEAALANEINLGALGTGNLQQTVSAGVATPSVLTATGGEIPYFAGTGLQATDSTLQWNAANKTLIVGTGTSTGGAEAARFERDQAGVLSVNIKNNNNVASNSLARISIASGTASGVTGTFMHFGASSPSNTSVGFQAADATWIFRNSFSATGELQIGNLRNGAGNDIVFYTNPVITSVEQLRILSDGSVRLASLAAGGHVSASVTTGQLSVSTTIPYADISGAPAAITATTGDVVANGPGSVPATIQSNAVSNAKLADMTAPAFKGRTTAGAGDPEDLTATQATAMLNVFDATHKGLVPAGTGAAGTFLTPSGTWAVPPGTGGGGTVTAVTATDPATATGTTAVDIGVKFDNSTITLNGGGALQALGVQATFITQTPSANLANEQALSAQPSGVMQSLTTTGVVSTYAVGAARIPFGSGTDGKITDSANLKLNGQTFGLGSLQEVQVYNDSTSATALAGFRVGTDASFTNGFTHVMTGTNWSGGALAVNTGLLELNAGAAPMVISNLGTGKISFVTTSSRTERMAILTGGGVTVSSLAGTGTRVVSASSTGLLAIASAAEIAAAQTWPASSRVLVSSGTTTAPTSDANFTYDVSTHALSVGTVVAVNGVTAASNDALAVGHTTNADRDHVRFFLGGGAAQDSANDTLFAVSPSGTTITTANNGGILATQRISSMTWTGTGSPTPAELASLYIDNSPTAVTAGSPARYAFHVAAGDVAIGALSAGGMVSATAGTGRLSVGAPPWNMVFTYGGQGLNVALPPLRGGAVPNFWMRPNSGYDSGSIDYAAQDQEWEYRATETYGSAEIFVHVYQCGLTTSVGNVDFTWTVTKNGVDTGLAVVAPCPDGPIETNTDYDDALGLAVGVSDRVGVRAHVTGGGTYTSGALRATVTLRLH